MSEALDTIGVCCAHMLRAHPGGENCVFCPCTRWKKLVGAGTRCTARTNANADPVAGRCWLAENHPKGVDHALEPQGKLVTRFTDESAYYPSDFTLSAESLAEDLRRRGVDVTAGQRISREVLEGEAAEGVRSLWREYGRRPPVEQTQCPYWYEGPGLSQNVRCDEPAGHGGHHSVAIGDNLAFRWTSDVAAWRDPEVTVEDVLDKLRRHGKVVPNPKPAGHNHADDEACTSECTQVGGDHYVKRSIGPWDVWQEYGMNAFEGAVLKYLLRWRDKNGVEDLRKARHTLDRLIELEEAKGAAEAG